MRLIPLVLVSIATTRVAAASPGSERAFRDGKELMTAGKLAEACEAFARSQTLEPGVGALLNLGDCRERLGQTATAWAVFREATALAVQTGDKREAEASRRAASLEPKLTYLTLTIAPDSLVEGLVIERNGTVVDPAAWNQPVPLDPGDYLIEASAPTYERWSAKQPLAPRQRVSLVIELIAVPAPVGFGPLAPELPPEARPAEARLAPGPMDGAPLPPRARAAPVPPLRRTGIGLVLGANTHDDSLLGGRLHGTVAAPGGAVRGIASMLYTNTQLERFNYLDDPSNNTSVYAFELAVDYLWMPVPRYAFAAGLGVGLDRYVLSLDQGSETGGRTALRASPIIVRLLAGQLELGLHLQLVRTDDGVDLAGLAALDVFPL